MLEAGEWSGAARVVAFAAPLVRDNCDPSPAVTCMHRLEFPDWSSAAQTTVVAPAGKAEPLAGSFTVTVCPTTLTVTTTNDSGPGSLRQAILDANACPGTNIIDFAPSAYGTILLTAGELLITDHLFINGPGVTNVAVDGHAASRVFHIGSNTVVNISGVTITNGSVSFNLGGGIYNDRAVLTVSNCTVSGNLSFNSVGGGICNDGQSGKASLRIINSTISGNLAADGAGIGNLSSFPGSAILEVFNSTVRGNSNTSFGEGGGIYNDAESGGSASLRLLGSTVSDNSAGYGGGVYNYSFNGTATIAVSNCVLSGNSAGTGGGIWNRGVSGGFTTVEILDSALSGNSATNSGGSGGGINSYSSRNLRIANSTLSGNSAIADRLSGGGSISTRSESLELVNCTISGSSGYVGGGIAANNATVRIANCTLSGNLALRQGGGIFSVGAGTKATLLIVNSTLSGNSAPSSGGGGIYNSAFSGGTASLEIGGTILNAGASGGAITNLSGTVTSLGYNLSSDAGGGVLTNATDQINTDPLLGPLQDNGGSTFTHALLCGSPAIDKGKNFSASDTDQRGFPRLFDLPKVINAPGGDGSDIGAFERQQVCNHPPVADASATVLLLISANGTNASVILDGSRSFDPDGDPLRYSWYEGATELASGVVAVTVLPVGAHAIQLVVNDGFLADANTITVEVITTAQAVEQLVAASNSDVSRSAPLRATLAAAIASIDRSNPIAGINQLLAFQSQVRAQVAPLDSVLADTFIRAAQQVIDALTGAATNPGGRPHGRFTSLTCPASGRVQVQFSGEPGRRYIIEASTNLVNWQMIGVAGAEADGSCVYEDAQGAIFGQRFYRIVCP